jgi:flagella basal body P-ring formation protein FlgA
MSKIKIFLPFICLFTLFPSITQATTWDRAYIENFAENYLQEKFIAPANGKVNIKVTAIDPRVIIKPCLTPLIANIPENYKGRNVNVKISCADSISWQIYLPARVRFTFPVLVAKATINKGTILDNDNIGIAYLEQNKIHGEKLTDVKAIIGGKAKKRIAQGRPINLKNICLICKGDSVTIIAKSIGFTIKTQGKALSAGNLHQQINVKNKQTGKIITAQVKAINQVVINL